MSDALANMLFFAAAFVAVMTPVAYFTTRKLASWLRADIPAWRASALSTAAWIAFFALGDVVRALEGDDPNTPGVLAGIVVLAHVLAFVWLKRRQKVTQ